MAHKIPQRKNIFETLYNSISKPISRVVVKTSLTPNQITIISGIFGIVGAYFLTCRSSINLIYAAVFIQLFTILDLVDGDVARAKNMQSLFGKWLDIFFDKLNDFLIILGLSIGQYWRTNDITALYLGMIIMGLVFFIQFSMVSNSVIFKLIKDNNSNVSKIDDKTVRGSISKKSLFNVIRKFISMHLLLEHCTFLFMVSLVAFLNRIYLGLLFLAFHAFFSLLFISIIVGIKLKLKGN